jgi:hypothetical protein
MASEREESSIGSLIGALINDTRELFRQEVNLFRLEVRQEVANAKAAAIKIGIAAFALFLAALFLLTALARGIADGFSIPIWAGFGIVGALLGIVGGVMVAMAGPNLRAAGPVPPRTAQTIKENVEWVKRQTS